MKVFQWLSNKTAWIGTALVLLLLTLSLTRIGSDLEQGFFGWADGLALRYPSPHVTLVELDGATSNWTATKLTQLVTLLKREQARQIVLAQPPAAWRESTALLNSLNALAAAVPGAASTPGPAVAQVQNVLWLSSLDLADGALDAPLWLTGRSPWPAVEAAPQVRAELAQWQDGTLAAFDQTATSGQMLDDTKGTKTEQGGVATATNANKNTDHANITTAFLPAQSARCAACEVPLWVNTKAGAVPMVGLLGAMQYYGINPSNWPLSRAGLEAASDASSRELVLHAFAPLLRSTAANSVYPHRYRNGEFQRVSASEWLSGNVSSASESASRARLRDGIAVIGFPGESPGITHIGAPQLAAQLISNVLEGHLNVQPGWSVVLTALAWLLVLGLAFAAPWLGGVAWYGFFTVSLAGLLLLLEVAGVAAYGVWVPVLLPALALALLAPLRWLAHQLEMAVTSQARFTAEFFNAVATQVVDPERSFALLRVQPLNQGVLESLLVLVREYEHRMQPQKSEQVLLHILKLDPGCKEALHKLLLLRERGTTYQLAAQLTQSAAQAPRPRQLGRYVIAEELRRTPLGPVYLGLDEISGEPHLLKTAQLERIFNAEAAHRARQRMLALCAPLGRMQHPDVLHTVGFGEQDGLAYYVCNHTPAQPITAFMQQGNLLPLHDVFAIIVRLGRVLTLAHQQQLLHLGLSPHAVLFHAKERLVVLDDFGMAQVLGMGDWSQGGLPLVTPYTAPELIAGAEPGVRSDVYGLAALSYHLLCGAAPLQGSSSAKLVKAILSDAPLSPREARAAQIQSLRTAPNKAVSAAQHVELPSWVANHLLQALHKQPGERPVNIEQFCLPFAAYLLARAESRVGAGSAAVVPMASVASVATVASAVPATPAIAAAVAATPAIPAIPATSAATLAAASAASKAAMPATNVIAAKIPATVAVPVAAPRAPVEAQVVAAQPAPSLHEQVSFQVPRESATREPRAATREPLPRDVMQSEVTQPQAKAQGTKMHPAQAARSAPTQEAVAAPGRAQAAPDALEAPQTAAPVAAPTSAPRAATSATHLGDMVFPPTYVPVAAEAERLNGAYANGFNNSMPARYGFSLQDTVVPPVARPHDHAVQPDEESTAFDWVSALANVAAPVSVPGEAGARRGAVNGAANGALNGAINGALNGASKAAVNGAVNGAINGAMNGAVNGAVKPAINGIAPHAVNGAAPASAIHAHAPSPQAEQAVQPPAMPGAEAQSSGLGATSVTTHH